MSSYVSTKSSSRGASSKQYVSFMSLVGFGGSPAAEFICTPCRAARAKGPSSPCSLAPRVNPEESAKSLRDKSNSEGQVRAAEGPKFRLGSRRTALARDLRQERPHLLPAIAFRAGPEESAQATARRTQFAAVSKATLP